MKSLKSFIVYDPASGEILRTGECPEEMVAIQAKAGEAVMVGAASDVLFKVVGGQVVDKAPSEVKLPPPPDPVEMLIQDRQAAILRRLAVSELKAEGKLPPDYGVAK